MTWRSLGAVKRSGRPRRRRGVRHAHDGSFYRRYAFRSSGDQASPSFLFARGTRGGRGSRSEASRRVFLTPPVATTRAACAVRAAHVAGRARAWLAAGGPSTHAAVTVPDRGQPVILSARLGPRGCSHCSAFCTGAGLFSASAISSSNSARLIGREPRHLRPPAHDLLHRHDLRVPLRGRFPGRHRVRLAGHEGVPALPRREPVELLPDVPRPLLGRGQQPGLVELRVEHAPPLSPKMRTPKGRATATAGTSPGGPQRWDRLRRRGRWQVARTATKVRARRGVAHGAVDSLSMKCGFGYFV